MAETNGSSVRKRIDLSTFSATEYSRWYANIYVPSGPLSAVIPPNDQVRTWLARQPNPAEHLGGTRFMFDHEESALRFAKLRWEAQLSIAFCVRIVLQPPTTEVLWEFDQRYFLSSRVGSGPPVHLDARLQLAPSTDDIIRALHSTSDTSTRMSPGG